MSNRLLKMRRAAFIAAVVLAVMIMPTADATIYKCISPSGQISFEDRPCPPASKEEALPERELPTQGSQQPPAPTTPEPAQATPAPAEPSATDGQVAGTIYGERFTLTRARVYKLGAYVLELKEGEAAKPDKAITIFLWGSEGTPLDGRQFTSPDPTLKQQPQIILIWTTAGGDRRQEEITSGYSLQLTFAQPAAGTIDGQITLALPDETSLNIAGDFTAEVDY